MNTVFTDWIGKRVVALCGRYIWRGLLVEERGPFALFEKGSQVVDHNAERIIEEIPVGPFRLNAAAIENLMLEEHLAWMPREARDA